VTIRKTQFTACALAALFTWALSPGLAQSTSPTPKEISMKAAGPFDVKITPQDDKLNDGVSRMLIEKHFHGDLEAASKGQMLASGSAKGSGVYVAIETVTGTLQGKTGSFALHHTGIMTENKPALNISVVPGSGTSQLAGIAGTMNIIIAPDGKHSYEFDYTLPPQ
jgi:Protein of unknown function (DUF3224)